jgi:hypothetical protein
MRLLYFVTMSLRPCAQGAHLARAEDAQGRGPLHGGRRRDLLQ